MNDFNTTTTSPNDQQLEPILCCQDLCKIYDEGFSKVNVLNQINFSVTVGERIAIIGSSGSGKTTLLNLLAGLDEPTEGSVKIAGQVLTELTENEKAKFRNRNLGFVYQFHHLLPEFSALENVMMPGLLDPSLVVVEVQKKATNLLKAVGLEERLQHKPSALSGGERQRVAIARALVTNPALVLLDEPTGNLDTQTAEKIQDLMLQLSLDHGVSFIVVTHNTALAARMDRVLQLSAGCLVDISNKG